MYKLLIGWEVSTTLTNQKISAYRYDAKYIFRMV